MKKILVILYILIYSLQAMASGEKQFLMANQLYQKANYDSALMIYSQLIQAGYKDDVLYFNIGNAYFKERDFPRALVYFEKALLLKPNNTDYQFNADYTRSLTGDKMAVLEEHVFKKWFLQMRSLFTYNQWSAASVIAFILSLVLAGIYLFSRNIIIKKAGFITAILLFIISVSTIQFAIGSYRYANNSKTAIIITPTVNAKSSPDISGTDLFVLHQGTKVEKIQHIGMWVEIKIPDGSKGWVEAMHFMEI